METRNFKKFSLTIFAALLLTLTGCDKSGTPSSGEGIIGIYPTPPVGIIDSTPPVITLNGAANMTVEKDTIYIEQNATAVDDIDGTVPVVITGTVDTSSVGVYTLTYTAIDSSGNESNVTRTVNVVYSGPAPLNANITIDNAALQSIIASIFDNTPYNPAISVQGVINNQGVTVSVPYTVSNAPAILAAYSTSVTLDPSVTDNDESGIVATFSWAEQNLPVGSGTFTATLSIDDSAATDPDNIYKAKRLDIEDDIAGLVAATFPYATDSLGGTGTLTLKIIPGIPDRMFGVADNTGDDTTHMFLYLPVTNTTTGKTWLNNNLGANYANYNSLEFSIEQQATASNDFNAYGSLFQWGRKADGHELINWTSSTTGTPVSGTSSTLIDDPTDALFITFQRFDWRVTQDDTLWATESSVNNVCPVGYRVPTLAELEEERTTWTTNNTAGAFDSELKISAAGGRNWSSGAIGSAGPQGFYWSASVDSSETYLNGNVSYTHITSTDITTQPTGRANGFSVRCIKN